MIHYTGPREFRQYKKNVLTSQSDYADYEFDVSFSPSSLDFMKFLHDKSFLEKKIAIFTFKITLRLSQIDHAD